MNWLKLGGLCFFLAIVLIACFISDLGGSSLTLTLTSNDIWITEDDSIILTAKAQGDSDITLIEFYEDTTLLAGYQNDNNSRSFTVDHRINATFADNGSHTFSAKAYDASSKVTSSPINISVTIGDDTQCTTVPSAPHIILIVSDDQTYEDLSYMPYAQQLLANEGTSFTRAFVTDPRCCPSRASILRGQYPHNHGVLSNKYPTGAYGRFYELGLENSTIATWLQSAGYYTALMGKYLNWYPGNTPEERFVEETYIPPGWDEWVALLYRQPHYSYRFNKNGFVRPYGDVAADYQVDVLKRMAVGFVNRKACDDSPFFLYLTPTIPHTPESVADRHKNLFNDLFIPRVPSLNEADMTDKPSFLSSQLSLTPSQLEQLDELYRNRLRMLQALDEMINDIIATLQAKGVLENTYLLFTSDNGFHLGQHRLSEGKGYPYEEDIKVPFVIRGPTIAPSRSIDKVVLNIDIAPTLAEWASASTPSFVDGRSLTNLLQNPYASWREEALFQLWNAKNATPDNVQQSYSTIRTNRFKYTEWYSKPNNPPLPITEYELYDLQIDPYEVSNIYGTADPALIASLKAKLDYLKTCQGQSCNQTP